MSDSVALSQAALLAWEKWVALTHQRCHLHFALEGGSIPSHVVQCQRSAGATIDRIAADLPQNFSPATILEVGASVGFNSIALARRYPSATVHSIEPDQEAVDVAAGMAADFQLAYEPRCGVGETLPYPDCFFDLIVCHTVIEHVCDVEQVIREMSRVLKPGGYLHIEAPNYFWPYEPHLAIWCIPLAGKPGVRFMARLQGQGSYVSYLGHLQFVTPWRLQRCFARQGLVWENRVKHKLESVLAGDQSQVVAYKRAGRLLNAINRVGLGKLLVRLVLSCGLFPSVLYTVRKPGIG